MGDELESISVLAHRLRRAIESVPPDELPLGMRTFPSGACGDAALLLGAYFADSDEHGFSYVVGSRGNMDDGTWTSHAWIERGGVVVDITADQFADAPAVVIVSANSAWHRGFASELHGPADFRKWRGASIAELHQLYARLRPVLSG